MKQAKWKRRAREKLSNTASEDLTEVARINTSNKRNGGMVSKENIEESSPKK